MSKLLFLHNELMRPALQRELRIPLVFVTFAYVEAKMYKHYRGDSSFILPLGGTKDWGNRLVYGGVFLLEDFNFYIRLMDAHHVCSMSTLFTNHRKDIHHRLLHDVTPIRFSDLNSMGRLMYDEIEPVTCNIYFGNPDHARIRKRIDATYRVVDGVDKQSFTSLYAEVKA